MKVSTFYACPAPAGIDGTPHTFRGASGECVAVHVEKFHGTLYVTVAATNGRECLAEWQKICRRYDIKEGASAEFCTPSTTGAVAAVTAWAEYRRDTIRNGRKPTAADSPATL